MTRWTDIITFLSTSQDVVALTQTDDRTAYILLRTDNGQTAAMVLDNCCGDWLHILAPLTVGAKKTASRYGTEPGMAVIRWNGAWALHQGIHQPHTTPGLVLAALAATASAAYPTKPSPRPASDTAPVTVR